MFGGQKIPSKFFMESDSCKRCHEDIYNQWFSSAHHFSSFNNQWYRKSIEYMQDTVGTQPSKWCGGCHDPAVLYSGLMDTPIKQIVHRPESQAGLGCMMCHSIADVKSTMGQGDFYLEYPKLHELAASHESRSLACFHDFLVKLNPEPHRRVFLKPFMREQTAEFCSSCHKVHLDVPVNHYRWIRGFNEYDNWQASGVLRAGSAIVLLSGEAVTVRGLPHAADPFLGPGQHRWLRPFASFPGGEHRIADRQRRRRATEDYGRFSEERYSECGYFCAFPRAGVS